MEVLFENQFVRNKELAREFCSYLQFRRPLRIVLLVLYFLALSMDVCRMIVFGSFPLVAIWIIIAGIIIVVIYFRSVSLMLRRDAEVYGGEVSVRTVVTEDHIQAFGPDGSSQEMKLGNIKSWIDTKHYIILCTKTKLVLFFRKDGFSKGSTETFCAFLAGRGIKRRHM